MQDKNKGNKNDLQQSQRKLKDMNNVGLDEGNDSEAEEGFNVEKYEAVPAFKDLYP